jgi:hypothetical protein
MSFKQNEIQVFGLDANALLPEDNSGDQAVVVPETLYPLDEAALTTFMDMISRLACTDPWDTEPYINSLQILNSLVVDAS